MATNYDELLLDRSLMGSVLISRKDSQNFRQLNEPFSLWFQRHVRAVNSPGSDRTDRIQPRPPMAAASFPPNFSNVGILENW